MEALLSGSVLLSPVSPTPLDAVAVLPAAWRNLGVAMLGWIGRRAELPVVPDVLSLRRPRRLRFGPPKLPASAEQSRWEHVNNLYQAWHHADNRAVRRHHLADLTQAFTPLIRATVKQYAVGHLAGSADLEQEAFLGLHDALQNYDPQRGAALAGFVRWRIVGAVLDARRKWIRQGRGYQPPYPKHNTPPVAPRILSSDAPPGETLEFEDLLATLSRGLSPRERLILRLKILEGKTCRQIGPLIGLHHARVQQVYRAAIDALRANPRARRLLADTT